MLQRYAPYGTTRHSHGIIEARSLPQAGPTIPPDAANLLHDPFPHTDSWTKADVRQNLYHDCVLTADTSRALTPR